MVRRMAITRFDVLNAISTRRERGYRDSADHDIADEIGTSEQHELTSRLDEALAAGEIVLVRTEPDGTPYYAITEDGERLVIDGLNE